MAAKFVLKKGSTGKFRFKLVATNGQVIATSEAYESKASAIKGIESVKRMPPLRSTTRPTSSRLVRVGSVRHGKPLVLGGHERSVSANKNRRSQAVQRHDLGQQSSPAPGSNPTSDPKAALTRPWRREARVMLSGRGTWAVERLAAPQSSPLKLSPAVAADQNLDLRLARPHGSGTERPGCGFSFAR